MTAELPMFYIQYLFYLARMTVRTNVLMLQFQGIGISDGQGASNKGSSSRSEVKWRKVRKAFSE
jgi:hypothetical protein